MKQVQFLKRMVSVFLCMAIMITTLLPNFTLSVSAEEGTGISDILGITEQAIVPTKETTSSDVFVIRELMEEREADTKHFLMSDGSKVAAIYSENVHYYEDSTWKEIDNDIVYNEKGKHYENAANSYAAKFTADGTTDSQISMTYNGYTIEFSYVDEALDKMSSTAEATLVKEKLVPTVTRRVSVNAADISHSNGVNSAMKAEKSRPGKVTYGTLSNNISLEYLPTANGVKENIVLNGPVTSGRFAFNVYADGMTLSLQDDGSIIAAANDTQETVFVIPAPYMFDNAGEHSYDVSYSLTQIRDRWIVTVNADMAWINDAKRTYPVKIDPAIMTEQDKSSVRSSFASSYEPEVCFYDCSYLEVGRYSGNGNKTVSRSFIDITLPELSSSQTIVSATLNMYGVVGAYASSTPEVTISVHELEQPFTCTSRTGCTDWNNMPKHSTVAEDFCVVKYGVENQWHSFDITKAVQKWIQDPSSQYGFMLMASNENTTTNREMLKTTYYSENNSSQSSQGYPLIQIAYRDTTGAEDYWTYTSMPAGYGGTAAVSNYSGNLVLTQPVAGIGGNILPVSIYLTMNQSDRAINKISSGCNVGYGWKINYNMILALASGALSDNGYKCYLEDADGTRHYFYFEDGATTGKNEDGLGYTLSINSSSSSARYVITDTSGCKMEFNSNGGLTALVDVNSTVDSEKNRITVTRDSLNRITSITDGSGRVYIFTYNSSGQLSSVTDPTGGITSFSYYNNQLYYISYPDGKSVSMNEGIIYNVDGTKTTVTHAPNGRVSSISLRDSSDNVHTEYFFKYNYNETSITDNHGRIVTYQFNSFAQTTGIIDHTTGMAQYYEYGAPGIETTAGTRNKTTSASKVQQSVPNLIDNGSFDASPYSSSTKYFLSNGSNSAYTGGYSTTVGHTGAGSCYFTRSSLCPEGTEETSAWLYGGQSVIADKAGNYTFSLYVSTNGQTLSGKGVRVAIQELSDGQVIETSYSLPVTYTNADEWQRLSASIDVAAGSTVRAIVGFLDNTTLGTAYFDDEQLERNAIRSSYNLINNASFGHGASASSSWWSKSADLTLTLAEIDDDRLTTFASAATFTGDAGSERRIYQSITVNGKAGDVFSFGAWAAAHSVNTNALTNNGNRNMYSGGTAYTPTFEVQLAFYNGSTQVGDTAIAKYNPNVTGWQFIGAEALATADYTRVTFTLCYDYNLNTVSFALPYLYKEVFGQSYTYDNDGNLISAVDYAETNTTFGYNDDRLTALAEPSGGAYLYSYQKGTNNLLYANSSSGQQYSFTYDVDGNPLTSELSAAPFAKELEAGDTVYIRNKLTGNTLSIVSTSGSIGNLRFDPTQDNTKWILVAVSGSENTFMLKPAHPGAASYYLYISSSGSLSLSASGTAIRFEKNNDGTYTLLTASSSYASAIDGKATDDSSTDDGSALTAVTFVDNDVSQHWYIYPAAESTDKSVSTSATYTEDGNYISTQTDATGGVTTYEYYGTEAGLNRYALKSVTDASGNKVTYTYDNSGRTSTVTYSDENGVGLGYISYTYNSAGYLTHMTRIAADSTTQIYKLNYDSFGRNISTEILGSLDLSGITLVENTYNEKNLLEKSEYGNEKYVTFTYDAVDRLIKTVYNDVDGAYEYVYDSQGRIGRVCDSVNDITTEYFYDLAGRPCEIVATDAAESALLLRTVLQYDEVNRLQGYEDTLFGTHSFETEYTYGDPAEGEDPNTVYSVSRNGSQLVAYAYDSLGRRTSRTLSAGNRTTTYTYEDVDSEHTTFRLSQLRNSAYGWYSYTYDEVGYIIRIDELNSSEYATYEYDALGQLIRENSAFENKTYTWTYDGSGNILSKKTYAFTTGALGAALDTDTYVYGNSTWKDQLTEYNGQIITYDEIGNPLQYRDGMSFTWQAGRQLKSVSKNGIVSTYTYNEDGIRTSKTVDGVTTEFIISGGQLIAAVSGNQWLYFVYNESGTIIGFTVYDGSTTYSFYYEFNAQGDVVALLSSSGSIVATYKYDAWGKLLWVYDYNGNLVTSSTHIGIINPIRYRGYFYDEETGFYYLNSRYYDPEISRFINADKYIVTGCEILGYNVFLYCSNNVVNASDPAGTCWHYLWMGDCESCAAKTSWIAPTSLTYSAPKSTEEKIISTGVALVESFSVSGGVGCGLEMELSAASHSISAGFHADYYHSIIDRNGGQFGTYMEVGCEIGMDGSELGLSYKYSIFHSHFCELYETEKGHYAETCPNAIITKGPDCSISLFSIGVYIGIGASLSLDFDTVYFCDKFERIWR